MNKKPFVTKEQIEEIAKTYPTPFHLYDEKGIRENAKRVKGHFPGTLDFGNILRSKRPRTRFWLTFYGNTAVAVTVLPKRN